MLADGAEKAALILSLKEATERAEQLQLDLEARTVSHDQLSTENEAKVT